MKANLEQTQASRFQLFELLVVSLAKLKLKYRDS